ncbi:melatonin receptor type 1C-like [Branchiostoma lanceolatum]|uniref:melatonin receptor type 1C-like n=1 Tax=Branchiostoma lanceolatum TaxID=7740 RepID=UPI0034543A8E
MADGNTTSTPLMDLVDGNATVAINGTMVAETVAMGSLVVLLTVFGIPGNAVIVISMVINPKLQTVANIFVLNIAAADLSVILLLLFCVPALGYGHWPTALGSVGCSIFGFLFTACCIASTYSLAATALNRWCLIVYPSRYHKTFTMRRSVAILAGLWVLAVVLSIPLVAGWGAIRYKPEIFMCTFDSNGAAPYTIFIVIAGTIIPLAVTAKCYIQLFWTVHRTQDRVNQRRSSVSSMSSNQADKQRLGKKLLAALIVFVTCWGPYAVGMLVATYRHVEGWVHVVTVWLALIESGLNAIIYGFMNSQLQAAYKEMFTRWKAVRKEKASSPEPTPV